MTPSFDLAIITGVVALGFALFRALATRAVTAADTKAAKMESDLEATRVQLESLRLQVAVTDANAKERLMQLEGALNSSWGVGAAVVKLNANVERLTEAVNHVTATVETLASASKERKS